MDGRSGTGLACLAAGVANGGAASGRRSDDSSGGSRDGRGGGRRDVAGGSEAREPQAGGAGAAGQETGRKRKALLELLEQVELVVRSQTTSTPGMKG